MKTAKRRAWQQVVTDPMVMGGWPTVRGTRMTVEIIVASLAAGTSRSQLLDAYPDLNARAIDAACAYARRHPLGHRRRRRIGDVLVGRNRRTIVPPDIWGVGALPGTYRGVVSMFDERLGLARIKPIGEGWSILVPVWKFPVVTERDQAVEFELGQHGGVVRLSARSS